MRTRRGGFTLVELMIVVVIMGILVRIALPGYHSIQLSARAAQALGDINAIRLAAYSYNADTGEWPPDVNRNTVPPELVPYLGPTFTFQREGYVLDWDNWMMPDGSPAYDTEVLLGISLTTKNAALGEALLNLVGESTARFTIADHYTFIIASN